MHDEDTCCVDGCDRPTHIRHSRKYPHLSGACHLHYHREFRDLVEPVRGRCLFCGAEFTTSRGARFCSHICAQRAYDAPGRICASCGERYWRRGRTSVCESCATERRGLTDRDRERRLAVRLIRPVLVPGRRRVRPAGPFVSAFCPECGDAFVMTEMHARKGAVGGRRFCSLACGRRSSRRDSAHLRRSRREGKRVDWAPVLMRDCWTCRLCGEPLDMAASVPDPLAPVMDHIVPLALGGEHAHYNVQAAHFICNSRKRDVLDGQVAMPV